MHAFRPAAVTLLACTATLPARAEQPFRALRLAAPCNTTSLREGPTYQRTHYGMHARVWDLSRREANGSPVEVSVADGLRGHRAGDRVRLRIEVVDRDGKAPDFPLAVYVAVVDPAWRPEDLRDENGPLRAPSLGNVGLPGDSIPCPAVLLRRDPGTPDRKAEPVEVEVTLGTSSRLLGLIPGDAEPHEATPLWAATERLDVLAGAVEPRGTVLREVEAAIGVRVEPGAPAALRWNPRLAAPEGEVSVSLPPPPAGSRRTELVLRDVVQPVDRFGNVVWGRFATSATRAGAGVRIAFGRPGAEELLSDAAYGVTVSVRTDRVPQGRRPARLQLKTAGRTVERTLTLRFDTEGAGWLVPADDIGVVAALPFPEPGGPRTLRGSDELARTVFRWVPAAPDEAAPTVEAWLEDRAGRHAVDAELVAWHCPGAAGCAAPEVASREGLLADVTPGADGYLAFGVRRAPGRLGPHFLVVAPSRGRVGAIADTALSRVPVLTVAGGEILGPDLDDDQRVWVDAPEARHWVVVDEEPGPGLRDFTLSASDPDGDDLGAVERLTAYRISASHTLVGRFDVIPDGSWESAHRPTPRRPTALIPGHFAIGSSWDLPGAPWLGCPPSREALSEGWTWLEQVNERPGPRLLLSGQSVAGDPWGGFVVGWAEETPYGTPVAARTRRFGPGGPTSPEIVVDEGGAGLPAVACDAAGGFVVAWSRASEAFIRSFGPDGTPGGPARRLGRGASPLVAVAPDGRVLAAWSEYRDGQTLVQVQTLAADGTPLGAAEPLPTGRLWARPAAVAALEAPFTQAPRGASWALVLAGGTDPNASTPHLVLLDARGCPTGPPLALAAQATQMVGGPSLAVAPDGRVLIVWESWPDLESGDVSPEARIAIVRSDGEPVALDVTLAALGDPSAVFAPDGGIVVAGTEGNWPEMRRVYLHRFDPSGAPLGPPERLDPGRPGSHMGPQLVADARGGLVVVWAVVRVHPKPTLIVARRLPP